MDPGLETPVVEAKPMGAPESFQAGRLDEAIAAQIEDVKAHPADHNRRLFLFELAAFAGDLDRARRQIDAIRYDEPERDAAIAAYRKLLDSEAARRRLFSEGLAPSFLGDPPPHLHRRLEAVNLMRTGRFAQAAEVLARAEAEAAPVRGELNGRPFETLRDTDDLFSRVVEVMADGKYFWIALEDVAVMAMNPPRFPRDLLFVPVRMETGTASGDVFLPALYPNSHGHADDQVRLGRSTDWTEREGGLVVGAGLRTFLVDDEARTILEWREYHRAEEPAPA
jgi:type VI secretion system protein ImpE